MMTRWLYEKHMINLPCTDPEIEITRHSKMDLTVVIPVTIIIITITISQPKAI